jgi:hypothetical protein
MIAACLVLVAIPLSLAAQSIVDGTFRLSGLIGLSRGQAASLNVTNSSREVKEVHFFFIDIDGRLLKSSSGRVLPGRSMGVVLSHSEIRDPVDPTGRVQVRAAVRFSDPPNPDSDPPQPDSDPPQPDSDTPGELVISSLEVFDEATGKTSFGLLLPAVRSTNVYLPATDVGVIGQEQR